MQNNIVKSLSLIPSVREKGATFSEWTRVANALICVHEGEIEIDCNRGYARAAAGECIFVPIGARGTTLFLGQENRSFVFLFELFDKSEEHDFTLCRKSHAVSTVIDDIQNAYNNGIVNMNYYFSAFYRIIFALQENKKIDKKYEKIHQLTLELNRNFTQNFKISHYAKEMLMSESGLRQLFKEYTGKTIIEYRNDVRLARADDLILSGMPICEAALQVGFSSPSYYCRTVSKRRKKK